mgnify:CR=1 FL=1
MILFLIQIDIVKDFFKLNSFKERVLSSGSEKINIHNGSGGGGNVGTGSELQPDTTKVNYYQHR